MVSDQENAALDKQIRALARLRALERILGDPQTSAHAATQHADDYAAALDHLAELGEDVEEFRFQGTINRIPHPIGPGVNRDLLRANVAAVLEYFTIRQAVLDLASQLRQEPAKMIGFEPP